MPTATSYLQDYHAAKSLIIQTPVDPSTGDYNHWRESQWLLNKLKAKVIQGRTSHIEETIFLGSWMRIHGDPLQAFKLHKTLTNRPLISPPERAFLLIELGADLLAMKKGDWGVSYFQQCLGLDRKHIYALHMLSRVYELTGEYQKSSLLLRRMIRLQDDQRTRLAFVLAEYAYALIDQGHFEKAKKTAEEAISADDHCPSAVLAFTDAQLVLKNYHSAIQTLKTFIRIWPKYTFMGIRRFEDAHYRQNQYSLVEDTLRECLQQTPDNPYLMYSIGKVLRKKKRKTEGLQFFKDALELKALEINSMRELIHYNLPDDDQRIVDIARHFFESLRLTKKMICSTCKRAHTAMHWLCSSCGNWGTLEPYYVFPSF